MASYHHQVPSSSYNTEAYTSWYQQCNCCPYGYHIDLDFVRYCESIGQQADRTDSIKRRKDRRRQRQSMEVLLGLEPPLVLNIEQVYRQAIEEEPRIQNNIKHPTLLQDGLEEAVSDFERTLQRSKNSNNLPDVTAVHDSLRRVPSISSMSSLSGSSMMVLPSTTDGAIRDCDVISIESNGLSPVALHNIREQMALSLERTKELEERVKQIPSLQAQLAALKEEKRLLLLQIKMEQTIVNGNYINNSATVPYSRLRSNSLTHSSSIENFSNKKFLSAVPRRDVGITCAVLTRNVGVGHQYPNTKSVSTLTLNGEIRDGYSDKWYNEKIKFLANDNQSISVTNNTYKEVNKPIVIAKGTQTMLAKEKKESSCQTLEIRKILNNNYTQTFEAEKTYKNIGVLAKVVSLEASIEAIIKTHTLGTSNDTINDILCSKCLDKNQHDEGLNTQLSSISLASLTVPRSKSFNLGEDKLNLRNRTVGCQYESYNLHKASQHELAKTYTKACQCDPNVTHKAIQYESSAVSKNTDTNDLDIVKKHVGCNTKETKIETTETACNTVNVLEKQTPCRKCFKKEKEDKKDDNVIPSRIPRPQIQTTPGENRKFKRQDTYTKIPSSANEASGLSGLDFNVKYDNELLLDDTRLEQVKTCYKLPEISVTTTPPNGENSTSKPEDESTLPETDLCHSPRAKVKPSKEMQAAMKVLNDSLQKGHAKIQLDNAINIIQEEWFKISSLVNAHPLDVEDYLDYFEDVSFDLLCYIVNMVDVSGNTAMHYAVSHGNFDVVSILLDSKVCDINQPNKAGYTSVMLVSLAEMCSATHSNVVKRLFQLADVNIRAKQHGQTALMLAVSHGRLDMVQMLLEAGADINIQDEDGSTALMCASEHGHIDIVKHFLSQPDCDSTVTDVDGSTALKIAMEAGHRHIGVLLYAHERNLHAAAHSSKLKRNKSSSPKTPSSPLSLQNSRRALNDSKQSK